jgi:hypothetical protein
MIIDTPWFCCLHFQPCSYYSRLVCRKLKCGLGVSGNHPLRLKQSNQRQRLRAQLICQRYMRSDQVGQIHHQQDILHSTEHPTCDNVRNNMKSAPRT